VYQQHEYQAYRQQDQPIIEQELPDVEQEEPVVEQEQLNVEQVQPQQHRGRGGAGCGVRGRTGWLWRGAF